MARPRTFPRTVPGKRDMQDRIDTLAQEVVSWKRRLAAVFERGGEDIKSRDMVIRELLWLLELWPVKVILFCMHPWILRRRKIRPLLLVLKTRQQVEGSVEAGYAFWNEYRLAQAAQKAKEQRAADLGRPAPPSAVPLQDGEEVLSADPKERRNLEASLGTARPPAKDVG